MPFSSYSISDTPSPESMPTSKSHTLSTTSPPSETSISFTSRSFCFFSLKKPQSYSTDSMPPSRFMLDKLKQKAKKKVRHGAAKTKEPTAPPDFDINNHEDNPSHPHSQKQQNVFHTSANKQFSNEQEQSPVGVSEATRPGIWDATVQLPLGTVDSPLEIGAASMAGVEVVVDEEGSGNPLRVRKHNQDCFGIVPEFIGGGDSVLIAVYDGHGQDGGEASRVARDVVISVMEEAANAHMARLGGGLLRDVLTGEDRRRAYFRLFTKAFLEAEKAMREPDRDIMHEYSGTTATCVWIDGLDVFVSWVGDSRAVLGRDGEVLELSCDQKPARQDEKKRIRASGGRITRWKKKVGPQRVWMPDDWVPGLAMTRSLGDTCVTRFGVIPNPEVTVTSLTCNESLLVVASDGVWEFMTSEEVISFVGRQREKGVCAEAAAKALVKEAVRRWTVNETVVDDTTAVVVFVERQAKAQPNRASVLLGKATGVKEYENRSLKEVFTRSRKVEISREAQIRKPWLIAANGKLEMFHPVNLGYDEEIDLDGKTGE